MAKNLNRCAFRLFPWPLTFQHFLNDLFLFIETAIHCNYADDNTMYHYANDNTVTCILQTKTLISSLADSDMTLE